MGMTTGAGSHIAAGVVDKIYPSSCPLHFAALWLPAPVGMTGNTCQAHFCVELRGLRLSHAFPFSIWVFNMGMFFLEMGDYLTRIQRLHHDSFCSQPRCDIDTDNIRRARDCPCFFILCVPVILQNTKTAQEISSPVLLAAIIPCNFWLIIIPEIWW